MDEENPPADKTPLRVAGMITSVTLKTTKNNRRMAFFTLEDSLAEIECVTFAAQFSEYAHLIAADRGVLVAGTVSLREDV